MISATTPFSVTQRSERSDQLKSELAEIVARALFVEERLHLLDSSNVKYNVCDDINQSFACGIDGRLAHWCQKVASGDWQLFAKRLQWEGLDRAQAQLLLLLPVVPVPLPAWAETLQAIMETARNSSPLDPVASDALPDLAPSNSLPFAEVWLPAVQVMRQKLVVQGVSPQSLLLPSAYWGLEDSLRRRLVNLCARPLQDEFQRSRPLGFSLLNRLLPAATACNTHYQAFVDALRQDGLLSLFKCYPVLGRLMATLVDFSATTITEFLQRLAADLPLIQQQFSPHQPLGLVAEIQPLLSDCHEQGQTVIGLKFESGFKLIYKPRRLGMEVAYNQFLAWCNQQAELLPFKTLTILDRQSYGWVEFVEHHPCADELAAHRLYQRAGMLLCLLYGLEGTDCHYENLIACGEDLVLVDAEALLHPRAKRMDCNLNDSSNAVMNADRSETNDFWDSVLRTGLLPRWEQGYRQTPYDISGLGSVDPQPAPYSRLRWHAINTDAMQLICEPAVLPTEANVPLLHGKALCPTDYLDDLVTGFQQMYRFLMAQREQLLSPTGPLSEFRAQQSRFIFRATQVYGMLSFQSLACLQDGMEYSIELDQLSRAYLLADKKPEAWQILSAERQALGQLDIPYFAVETDSDGLTVGSQASILHYFERSGYDQVRIRLQKLTELDLTRQVAIMRGAFYAKTARVHQPGTLTTVDRLETLLNPQPLTAEQLVQAAETIAASIRRQTIREPDGSVNWIGLSQMPKTERLQLQPLGVNLYDGKCGVVLFLAALDRIRQTDQHRELSLAALQPLRQGLKTAAPAVIEQYGQGGILGVGSLIYTLVKLSDLLAEPALLADARRLALGVQPSWVAADRRFDVMSGAAGTLLGLLTLYRKTADPTSLAAAIACGQHLSQHRVSVDGSPAAWQTLERQPLTGFSHGAAGIAYALLQLYALTQNPDYLAAAKSGIAYEQTMFSAQASNWFDFRGYELRGRQPGFMVSWCHGAPGIALGRLGGLPTLATAEMLQDIEVGLQKIQTTGFQGVDFPCCGNLGLTEVLIVAAEKLDRPELLTWAHQRAAMTVRRAEQTGGYQLTHRFPGADFSLGFFQGMAGIGYELLRLVDPHSIPSVLLLA